MDFRPVPGRPGVSRHGRLTCDACGYQFDAASNSPFGGAGLPTNDDFSICWGCGEVRMFVVGPFGVSLRMPTLEELQIFARIPGAVLAVRELHRMRAEGRGGEG